MLLSLAILASCASTPNETPYGTASIAPRDTARAEELAREAADLVVSEPERAEAMLRDALAADLFHGPAHNNLGVIHLKRGELYEAAHEFEWARKLMPGHPDPRFNLAMTLELAGRSDDAVRELPRRDRGLPRLRPRAAGTDAPDAAARREGRAPPRLARDDRPGGRDPELEVLGHRAADDDRVTP